MVLANQKRRYLRGGLGLLAWLAGAPLAVPWWQAQTTEARISGVVRESGSRQPVEGAVVLLSGPGSGRANQQTTGPDGSFTFERLPPGTQYRLHATKEGYLGGSFGRDEPHLSRVPILSRDIVLQANQRMAGIELHLWPPGSIAGSVVDANGEPVVGGRLRTLTQRVVSGEYRWVWGAGAVTDDRGNYRIGGLGSGEYVVSLLASSDPAELERDRSRSAEVEAGLALYYPSVSSLVSAVPVAIDYGQERRRVDFHLPQLIRRDVRGRVDGPPEAIEHCVVRLVPAGSESLGIGSEIAVLSPKLDGTFTVASVPPGRYVVQVGPSTAALTAPNASTPLLPAWLQRRSGFAQFDGIGMGDYAAPNASPFLALAELDVPTSSSEPLPTVILRLQRGATIAGRVEIEGKPATGVAITAERAGAESQWGRPTVRVGEHGEFRIEGLHPGEYVLQASTTRAITAIRWKGQDYADRPLSVGPSTLVDEVVVALGASAAVVSGSVRYPDGKPALDSIVVHFPTEARLWTNYGTQSERVGRVLPDSSGHYRIRDLPEGEYFVVAVVMGDSQAGAWRSAQALGAAAGVASKIRVVAGQSQVLDLGVKAVRPR